MCCVCMCAWRFYFTQYNKLLQYSVRENLTIEVTKNPIEIFVCNTCIQNRGGLIHTFSSCHQICNYCALKWFPATATATNTGVKGKTC